MSLLTFLKKKRPVIAVQPVKEEEDRKLYVGDEFVDNDWEDTIIYITAISKNRKRVRYRYLKVRGVAMSNVVSDIYETSVESLNRLYKKI